MKILSEQIFRIFYLCLDFMGGCLAALRHSWLWEQLWLCCCCQTFRTHQREQQALSWTMLGVLCNTGIAAGNLCTTTSASGFAVWGGYHCSTPAPQHCCPYVPGSTKIAVYIFPSGKSWVKRGWFYVWWSNLSLGMLYVCQSKIPFHTGPIQVLPRHCQRRAKCLAYSAHANQSQYQKFIPLKAMPCNQIQFPLSSLSNNNLPSFHEGSFAATYNFWDSSVFLCSMQYTNTRKYV